MYYILPFKFAPINGKELITNDFGDYLFVPRGTVSRIVNKEVKEDEEKIAEKIEDIEDKKSKKIIIILGIIFTGISV